MTPPRLQDELGKTDPFEMPQEEAYLGLLRTASELEGPMHELFKWHKLSQSTYNVLRILRGHGQRGVPCQSIGPMMVQRLPDVTRLVDRLVERGLAERDRCEEDRRVVYVKITKAGRALLKKLDEPVKALHHEQFGGLTDSELNRLIQLLDKARG